MNEEITYKIIRFYKDGKRETVKADLTLEEAKEYCSDDSTSGDNWFDGFEKE